MSQENTTVTLTVNGKKMTVQVPPTLLMGEFLQETLGLTGTKICCGMGVCKACTIAYLKPGDKVYSRTQSCVSPVASLQNCDIKTVEGLAEDGKLSPLQEAFLKNFSFQCGYSTPGFLMGAFVLISQLQAAPIPKEQVEEAIQDALGQHYCRCSGYVKYYAAIREVILSTPGLVLTSLS